jgi:hypothetical protein
MLLDDLGRRANLHWFLRSCAMLAFIIINPQYVNISALYSGSLMILALIYASLLFCESLNKAGQQEIIKASIPFTLIAATLVSLKQTFAPYAVSYCIIFFIVLFIACKQRRRTAMVAGISAAMTVIMLAPWIFSVSDKILIFYHKFSSKIGLESVAPAQSSRDSIFSDLFSAKKLFYGGYTYDFTFAVLCSLALAFLAIYWLLKKKGQAHQEYMLVLIPAGISLFIAYIANAHFARAFDVGIRYSAPLIIAGFPSAAILFAAGQKHKQSVSFINQTGGRQLITITLLIICIGMFARGTGVRLNILVNTGTMLSFPIDDKYIQYNQVIMSNDERQAVLSIQNLSAADSTILAWFEAPFHLDFARNNIFTLSAPEIVKESAGFKKNDLEDPVLLKRFLRNSGIRYVLWGYAEVPKARYPFTFELENGLEALARQSPILFNDGRRVMFELSN